MTRTGLSIFALTLLSLCMPSVEAQSMRPTPGAREAMWPAPTAEDWAKPCLIQWQRNWEDAKAASRETQRPILICVNMDGEIASEHYAGIRYRQPEITELYAPYITVIASVYRHTPRDYDDQGRRIVCPRFGTVTCGEHIAIEPLLYEKYFEGSRISPRHIAVELDGEETYDVFYANDTISVFTTIQKGITEREGELLPRLENQGPIEELVTSHYSADQAAVEAAYAQGSQEQKRKIMKRVVQAGKDAPLDLMRMAVFGLDLEMARLARQGLAAATDVASIDLIAEALKVPMDAAEREALILALERLGAQEPRARTLAVVQRGLASKSEALSVSEWSTALKDTQVSSYQAADRYELEASVKARSSVRQAPKKTAEDFLELAEASFALAIDPSTTALLGTDVKSQKRFGRVMFSDAKQAALDAERLGAKSWRVDTLIALSAYYQGEYEESYVRAERAVKDLPSGEESWNAMALLALFAQARQVSIQKAQSEEREWPASWLTDVNAAYSVLARHPLGTDLQVVAQYDFLHGLGATSPAGEVLSAGLKRHPASGQLHSRLRKRLLDEQGIDGLESAYERMLVQPDAHPSLPWYAGLGSIVAAEFHRRAAADDRALAAYDRCIQLYELSNESNPDWSDSSNHYIALALAGQAHLLMQREDLQGSLEHILARFEKRPMSAASLDGLNISPAGTAKLLRSVLSRKGDQARLEVLQGALDRLDALDRSLLDLPEFEREVRPRQKRQRQG